MVLITIMLRFNAFLLSNSLPFYEGKSALVRGLCKQFNVPTIQVMPSLLLRKYVGETSQLTKAVFSLAVKLQPCILFCDEMDSLFRTRTSDDAAVDRNIKTECSFFK